MFISRITTLQYRSTFNGETEIMISIVNMLEYFFILQKITVCTDAIVNNNTYFVGNMKNPNFHNSASKDTNSTYFFNLSAWKFNLQAKF